MGPRERIRAAVAGLPPVFWWVWAGTLINRLGFFVLPFLALYLTQVRHLSVETTGWLLATFGAGTVGGSLAGGQLADRIGRRATLILSLYGGALFTLVIAVARSPLALGAALLVTGLAGDCYRPAVAATVADVVKPADRARAYGLLYWAATIGLSLAFTLAGFLVTHGYWLLFIGDALTTALFAVLVLVKVPETRAGAPRREHPLAGLALAGRDPNLVAFTVLGFLFTCVILQFTVALPIDLARHGISPDRYGLLIAFQSVVAIIAQPLFMPVIRRFARAHVLAVAGLLVGLGFGVNAFATTWPGYAFAMAIWTIGVVTNAPLAPSVVADLAPDGHRGSYQGLWSTSTGLANFAAPAIGSFALERFGSHRLWVGCIGVGVFLAFGQLTLARARRIALARRGLASQEDRPIARAA